MWRENFPKGTMAKSTMLAHLDTKIPVSITVDTSDSASKGVLQRWTNDSESRDGTFAGLPLPNYCEVRYLHHSVEDQGFTLSTDCKLFFRQVLSRQPRWLDYILLFALYVQHISGTGEVVVDTLSRITFLNNSQNVHPLKLQEKYANRQYKLTSITLKLKIKPIGLSGKTLLCYPRDCGKAPLTQCLYYLL